MSSYLATTSSVSTDSRRPLRNRTYRKFSDTKINNALAPLHAIPEDDDAPTYAPSSTASAQGNPEAISVDTNLQDLQRRFSAPGTKSISATAPAPVLAATAGVSEKLDHIIRILEDRRDDGMPTDDVVMYAILGLCAVYVIDGIMR
jgi:hypothetical protein